jgi:hypothetical protein
VARRYTEERFRDAVADPDVRTLADLCRALGIVPRGGNYETVRRYAAELGLDLDACLARRGARRRVDRSTVTDTTVRQLVASHTTLSAVIDELGWPRSGASYRWMNATISRLRLDTSHLRGRGWAAGRERPARRRTLEPHLTRGRLVTSSWLRKRLIEDGYLEARCARCRRHTWEGQPIPLELDHIDGDRTNNLLSNLRLLCPNCHALTPTYRGRNIGRWRTSPDVGSEPEGADSSP